MALKIIGIVAHADGDNCTLQRMMATLLVSSIWRVSGWRAEREIATWLMRMS